MKITVVGIGYVGLSNAILLALNYKVISYDIDEAKVKMLNNRISPISDKLIEDYLSNKKLDIYATSNSDFAYRSADYVIIATPTNYDPILNNFDTTTVDNVINDIYKANNKATVVIKSTVPIGYTEKKRIEFPSLNLIFSPEFLREGNALYDNLFPSRIIIGGKSKEAKLYLRLVLTSVIKKDTKVIFSDSNEAEAIKLFSNTYLAMRVAFFNEMDTYSEIMGFESNLIVQGISSDPRIGDFYNNPSFGYGGYCLPKDTKQLLSNFGNTPQKLMKAIVESNEVRKEHIVNMILKKNSKSIGIYRLAMKFNSDNFRESSVLDIINKLNKNNVRLYIYEPLIDKENFHGIKIIKDFNEFKLISELIVANRISKELDDVKYKVYTRDLYNRD